MSEKSVYKWSAIDRGVNSIMTFGGNIVLARLLEPADFGLVAMVAIFIAVAQNLSSSGMSDGLIYKSKPTEQDYSTVFVFNSALGLFFCILFISLSGVLSHFFEKPQIEGIMIAVGVCFFIQTMTFAQETRLRKLLDMKTLAIAKLLSTASATALGIAMAAYGMGYWALVVTHSGLSVFLFFYYVLLTRWFPKIAFYSKSFKEMFGYGVHLMAGYVVNQVGRNVNTSLLGKYNTEAVTGLYAQAQKLQEVPYALIEAVFCSPFFPVLSNESDPRRRLQLSANMHMRLWTIAVSVALFLLLVSWPAFNLLYGSKWDGSIPIFRLLLIFGVSSSLKSFYQVIFKTYGHPKLVRNLSFLEVGLQLALLAFFYNKGVMMIAFTQVLASVVIMIVNAIYYRNILNIKFKEMAVQFVKAVSLPVLVFGLAGALTSMWYYTAGPLVNCVCITFVSVALSLLAYIIFRPSWLKF